jgi:hypothetical protein
MGLAQLFVLIDLSRGAVTIPQVHERGQQRWRILDLGSIRAPASPEGARGPACTLLTLL